MDSVTLIAQMQEIDLWPEDAEVQAKLVQLQQELTDARLFCRELLKRDLITAYQANQLLTERGKNLVVGPYRIEERLGEGATARIFKAHHYLLHRVVALKLIRPERIRRNPSAVERFLREARAAALLSHPNVVRAYDAGSTGERYYFAMQFLDGVDLTRLVAQERLEIERVCDYMLQAARGLQHIHENSMIHRDIKPSNLMVIGLPQEQAHGGKMEQSAQNAGVASKSGDWGQIKILDLGLARLDEDPAAPNQKAALTKIGTVMGTPDYMAPEQALHSRNADIRSDIYSLGCTFYFALTGRPPFPEGDAFEKMLKHQLDEPPPVEAVREEVPLAARRILQKMMAKKPEGRFQTPYEVVAALQSLEMPPSKSITPAPELNAATASVQAAIPFHEEPTSHAEFLEEGSLFADLRNLGFDLSHRSKLSSTRSEWSLWLLLAIVVGCGLACLVIALALIFR